MNNMVSFVECKDNRPKDEQCGKCKTGENEKKRYTVKIHIDKCPKQKVKPTQGSSGCPPDPLICGKCKPPLEPKCEKPIIKSNCRKQENSCQTDICQRQWQSCGTTTSSTQRAHCQCQTIGREYVHCEQQTSICGGNTCTKDCQTELDHGCNAVGVCHNKTTRIHSRRKNMKELDCLNKHSFPFAGRTPSGHLKIHPNMVSYENRQFSILVGNQKCVRTTVKRLISCEEVPEKTLGLQNIGPSRFYSIHSPGKSAKDKQNPPQCCPTPAPRQRYSFPSPQMKPDFEDDDDDAWTPHSVTQPTPDLCLMNDIEDTLQSSSIGSQREKCTRKAKTNTTQYHGHTNGWNYVNPVYNPEDSYYRNSGGSHRHSEENEIERQRRKYSAQHSPGKARKFRENENESYKSQRADPRQMDRFDYGDTYNETGRMYGKNNPHLQDHTDITQKQTWRTGNNTEQSYSGATHGSFGNETESLNYDKRAPYTPSFPRDRNRMSDSEDYDYHTIAEERDTSLDQDMTSHYLEDSTVSSYSEGHDQKRDEKNPDLYGKLHYIVKGAVDQNQKVRVGNTVLPVQSVVLEIFDTSKGDGTQKVKLPEFKALESEPERVKRESVGVETLANKNKRNHEEKKRRSTGTTENLPMYNELQAREHGQPQVNPLPAPRKLSLNDENTKMTEQSKSLEPPLPPYEQGMFENFDIVDMVMKMPDHSKDELMPTSQSRAMEELDDMAFDGPRIPIEEKETMFAIVENPSKDSTTTQGPQRNKPETTVPTSQKRRSLAEKESDYEPKLYPGKNGVLPNLDTQSGSILVFGGINPVMPTGANNSGRDVYMYTLDVNMWVHVGMIPKSRAHCGVAKVGNHIYLIGQSAATSPISHVISRKEKTILFLKRSGSNPEERTEAGKSQPVRSNLRLNLRSGEWDEQAEMENPRSHFGCAAIGKNIFVVGGNLDSRPTQTCLVFNTENGGWKSIASLDGTRTSMGIIGLTDCIIVAGGATKDSKRPILDSVIKYEPAFDRWSPMKSLPSPRAFCTMAFVAGKMYVVAGAGIKDINKRKNSSLPNILGFNTAKKDWEEVGVLTVPRHGQATAVLDDSIIILGGVTSTTMGPLDSIEILSTSTGEIKLGKRMVGPRTGLAVAVL